jgi:DNA repair exonuclease SbcCD ATPase subunit
MGELATETAQNVEGGNEQVEGAKIEAQAEETVEEQVEQVETPKVEETQPSRAQKRIQALAQEKNQLAQQLAQQQQYFAQQMQNAMKQQQEAFQAQMQEQQKQRDILQRQLELIQTKELRANESPYDKFRRENEENAVKKAREALNPELEALKHSLESEKKERERLIEEQKNAEMYQRFQQQTVAARQFIVTKDLPQDKVNDVAQGFDNVLLGYIASTGLEPQVAAQQLKGFLDKYYQARLSSNSKTVGSKVKAAQQIPSVPNQAKQTTKDEYYPSWAELNKAGYSSYGQWRQDGAKVLSKK